MKDISKRTFLKTLGGGVIASSALLSACRKATSDSTSLPEDQGEEGTMTYRTSRTTGERISLLGYGMMRLPVLEEGEGTARERHDATIDQETVNRLVDYAIEHGVNYFDTSPAYCQGLSERSTGIALSRHPRSSYYVATKMSNFSEATQSRTASQEMLRNSLRELKVDYIDYLLLHSVGGGDDSHALFNARFMDNGILDWLVEQRTAGVIRNLGFSFHGDVGIFDMLMQWHDEGKYHWDFVQIELNYIDWSYAHQINPRNTDASYLYGELEKRGIQAVIMEPLLGGRLSSMPDAIVEKMKTRRPESTVASWAFRFAGSPEGVLTVLSGMTYLEHLQENVATYSPLQPLSEEERQFLEGVAHDYFNLNAIPCNECNYCMPCPYGINIPAVFTHYNRCLQEGNLPNRSDVSREYKRARRAFLIGYDRSVPRLRQAAHCIGCRQCVEHCPQGINIPREMQRIDALVEELKQSL